MASTGAPKIRTLKADGAIAKGKAVKAGSDKDHVAIGAANTDRCIGIAQVAAAASGDFIEYARPGDGAKGLLGETVVAGNDLVSHTDGSLVLPNASADQIIARALQGGASGDLIDVEVYMAPALASQ